MRMWMINPELLCNKHLLGEHYEIHKHRHNFEKKHSVRGRMYPVIQIEPKSMQSRHDELVVKMDKRKMKHNSPYQQPDISYLENYYKESEVDVNVSIRDLCERCDDCKARIE